MNEIKEKSYRSCMCLVSGWDKDSDDITASNGDSYMFDSPLFTTGFTTDKSSIPTQGNISCLHCVHRLPINHCHAGQQGSNRDRSSLLDCINELLFLEPGKPMNGSILHCFLLCNHCRLNICSLWAQVGN